MPRSRIRTPPVGRRHRVVSAVSVAEPTRRCRRSSRQPPPDSTSAISRTISLPPPAPIRKPDRNDQGLDDQGCSRRDGARSVFSHLDQLSRPLFDPLGDTLGHGPPPTGVRSAMIGDVMNHQQPDHPDLDVLRTIEQRVLWLATRIIDHANRRPPCPGANGGDVKVGGHQASSASMVSIMTALWFAHIGGEDKVAVKPHASPVYHAIKYLTGELDRSYLTTLRQRGGLQAYPSRTKDPDVADFSTGSVGLGAVAPLFSSATRRFLDAQGQTRPPARFIATVGDAELDEGNVWEAIVDPATQGLGNVTLVVDLNRQSLDRVVPDIAATRLQRFFADAGWHVVEAKYGRLLQKAFAEPGGDAWRARIDEMPNEAYQSLFALRGDALRAKFLDGAAPELAELVAPLDDDTLASLVFNLGGHD